MPRTGQSLAGSHFIADAEYLNTESFQHSLRGLGSITLGRAASHGL
jgi:hypothetical protein